MIDCHLHLHDVCPGDAGEVIGAVRRENISCLVTNGTHPGDWEKVADLARRYPEVIPCFGVHPWKVNGIESDWEEKLGEWLGEFPLSGVGEVGLDRWITGHHPSVQKEIFQAQLKTASTLRRPLSVHCLRAWGTLFECLREADLSAGCLLHSYGGPVEMVKDFADLGVYFSLSGYFFKEGKEEKLRVFEEIPADRHLLESDAPDMMPPPGFVRIELPESGGRPVNHPANLVSLYEAYSAWQGIRTAETVSRMRRNFAGWFFRGDRSRFLSRFPFLTAR
jgi:TatD DNase family protein